jgi:uncharacterized protein YndB with AHSA1/START domain
MKIALIIVSLLVVAGIVIYAIGARLPVHHVATRTVHIAAPPARVYALIRDFGSAPTWRKDVKRVELLADIHGFREHGHNGAITYEVLEDVSPSKLVTRIVDRNLGFGGSWTYDLTPDGDGTLLRITENGEVTNVLFRFMSRYVFGHTATIEKVQDALAKHFAA